MRIAERYLRKPYVPNGTSPSSGFDDLGFVRYVYQKVGILLPADRVQMLAAGPRVDRAHLRRGDLVFFQNTIWAGLSHVGIYIGHGQFIHAEWYRTGVTITSFLHDPRDGNYWDPKFYAANDPLRRA